MAEVENLSIVISILDRYTDELVELMGTLEAVERTAEKLDPIRIDVEVDSGELGALEARLAALEMADMAGFGDVSVGAERSLGGGFAARSSMLRDGASPIDAVLDQLGDMNHSLTTMDKNLRNVNKVAGAASHGLKGAEEAGGFLDLRMSTLHNILAKLIPLILTFIGAIPALIGAIGSLAAAALAATAALAGIAGLGLLGAAVVRGEGDIGAGFQEIVSEMKSDFLDAFREVSTAFAPLMEDALDGFDRLMQDVANVAQSAFTQITDEARAFGAFLADAIPGLVQDIAGLTEAFGPLFGIIADSLGNVDIAARIANFMADVLPALESFVSVLMDVLPALFQMSIGFLRASAAVMNIVGAVGNLISVLDIFGVLGPRSLGLFVGSLFAAITAVAILNSQLVSNMIATMLSFANRVILAAVNMGMLSGATISSAAAFRVLQAAILGVATAIALTGIGLLLTAVGALGSAFLGTSSKIDTAADSLREFNDLARRSSRNPYGAPSTPDQVDAVRGGKFAGSGANITINAQDSSEVDKQAKNLQFRMSRTGGTL